MMNQRRFDERGASLIELMVVLVIIGIMVAYAGEGFVAAAAKEQRHAVSEEVATELRAARALALTRRQAVRVVFHLEERTVDSEWANAPGSIIRHYDFRRRGATIEGLSNGPNVVFYPSGRSATPTTVRFRNHQGQQWMLTVSLTGRVTIK
jgi:type IV fimbrial biogenesis protein FimT